MRKLLAGILTVLVIGWGSALAQQDPVVVEPVPPTQYFAGGGLGFTSFVFGLHGHFGVRDVIAPNIDVRGDLGIGFLGFATVFGIGANVLFNFDIDPEIPLNGYAGGGPRVFVVTAADVSGAGFGLGLLGGAEFRVNPDIGIFGELGFDFGFGAGAVGFAPAIRAGANFHF